VNTYFSSDLHINHVNILKYCNRPFATVEEMNEAIITNFNSIVKPNDVLYILGDVGFGDKQESSNLIQRLRGVKLLVVGNHDRLSLNSYYRMGFSAVLDGATIRIGKTSFCLSHYPRKSLWSIIKLFLLYTKKMYQKERSFQAIWLRLKREWTTYRAIGQGEYCLHGHIHSNSQELHNKNLDVGVDAWDFKPVSSQKILDIVNKDRANQGSWRSGILGKFFSMFSK